MMNYRNLLSFSFLLLALTAWAQPNGTGNYYQAANGKKGRDLKTALFGIIKNPDVVSYDGLWSAYLKTDLRSDGKIWDMYSDITNFDPVKGHAANYKKEGDSFNREHSFPKSWFSKAKPMLSDAVHVVPTDGYVNGRRSNYPYGETDGGTWKSHGSFSKLGACSLPGYSGTVFEPNDEYKGDFARIYFYMATCYEDKISSWSSDMLSHNPYPAYKQWVIDMLLRWAKNDPVSKKEIDRNNAIQGVQGNRNPFVDYPGLEQYIWGNKTDVAFSYDNYDYTIPDPTPDPTPDPKPDPNPDPNPNPNPDPNPDPTPTPEPSEGEQVYTLVASAADLAPDTYYLLVRENENGDDAKLKSVALSDMLSTGKAFGYANVTVTNNTIVTKVNEEKCPHELYLAKADDTYTLCDVKIKKYLSLTSSDNALMAKENVTGDGEKWTITLDENNAIIANKKIKDRTIRFNAGSPRFACYKGSQQPVQLYKKVVANSIKNTKVSAKVNNVVYSIDGRRIMKIGDGDNPYRILPKGMYIIGGRKVVVGN